MVCPFCETNKVKIKREVPVDSRFVDVSFICKKGHDWSERREKTYIELMQDVHDNGTALFRELTKPLVPFMDWLARKLKV